MQNHFGILVRTLTLAALTLAACSTASAQEAPLSEATQACLECHTGATPGIVADWRNSAHARTTPETALQRPAMERRFSAEKARKEFQGVAVGCAECHTLHPRQHQDTVEHDEFQIHPVVTPADCAVCHPAEVAQFDKNKMAWAYPDLMGNPLYMDLVDHINGEYRLEKGTLEYSRPDPETQADSCLFCHGTKVEVKGTIERETDWGEFTFPVLTGWPNRGVGRLNPDGTKGSCSACHTRHAFSVEMARKPAACAECHKGPDVPAYNVYGVSKHGAVYENMSKDWDFKAVPWALGRDFSAPTCAVCHISLTVNPEGEVINQRTHRMNDRLDTRIMGLIYTHAQPKHPDTSRIKHKSGLTLAVDLEGNPAAEFLITPAEQEKNREAMQRTCLGCHSRSWVEGHFRRLENTIKTTDDSTKTATRLLQTAWKEGLAQGPDQGASPFDEPLELKWVEQWLFYANSTRFASAMMGADYGVFERGRWKMHQNIKEMAEWLNLHRALKQK